MLARLLPLLAILVLCVLGYFVYTQDSIQQLMKPTVVAVETKRPLIDGMKVRKGFIATKEVGINRVQPGMITFPAGTTPEDVEKALSAQTVAKNIPKETILRSNMLGESSSIVVLRAMMDIGEGENLSMDNIEAGTLEVAPPGGAIVFDTEEEAFLYINKAYDLAARQSISSGQILTIDDTAGAAEKIFVVRTTREFERSERLSINGLEAAEMQNKDLPAGAIAFQTRGATDIFITAAGRYILSDAVETGSAITAEMISAAAPEIEIDPNELPSTLAELISYMKAYPDRAMFLNPSNYIGTQPDTNDRVDLWAEVSRTDGEFGQIHIERLAEGLVVQGAIDTSVPEKKAPGATDQEGAPVTSEENASEDDEPQVFYWVSIDPSVKRRFDNIRKDEKIGMMVHDRTRMMHLLGNGASCIGDFCQINRKSSKDLAHVEKLLEAEQEDSVLVNKVGETVPLMMIDGVSAELAKKMEANGYGSFETIAAWSDTEIPAVTIKLDISNNLAVYIRQQARILSSSADKAAEELGFEVAPSE